MPLELGDRWRGLTDRPFLPLLQWQLEANQLGGSESCFWQNQKQRESSDTQRGQKLATCADSASMSLLPAGAHRDDCGQIPKQHCQGYRWVPTCCYGKQLPGGTGSFQRRKRRYPRSDIAHLRRTHRGSPVMFARTRGTQLLIKVVRGPLRMKTPAENTLRGDS